MLLPESADHYSPASESPQNCHHHRRGKCHQDVPLTGVSPAVKSSHSDKSVNPCPFSYIAKQTYDFPKIFHIRFGFPSGSNTGCSLSSTVSRCFPVGAKLDVSAVFSSHHPKSSFEDGARRLVRITCHRAWFNRSLTDDDTNKDECCCPHIGLPVTACGRCS
uniref:Uncharacterized protein n=1 Tax=Molossus molossus TaxID=27622 RepID=A0A7J8CS35_MOLMO|nr:hypothetical protein HJG59_009832 [Molossus molossus]